MVEELEECRIAERAGCRTPWENHEKAVACSNCRDASGPAVAEADHARSMDWTFWHNY